MRYPVFSSRTITVVNQESSLDKINNINKHYSKVGASVNADGVELKRESVERTKGEDEGR